VSPPNRRLLISDRFRTHGRPRRESELPLRHRTGHPHENHERWMVSYADFVTLLFAFFVVMFASTQADKGKARQVSASVREALAHGQVSDVILNVLGRGRHDKDKRVQPDAFEELPV